MTVLAKIKQMPIFTDSSYSVTALPGDVLLAVHQRGEERVIGLFSMTGGVATVQVPLADGNYRELITGETVTVVGGDVRLSGTPMVLHCQIAD